ncbi:MAG: nuclear transport factor 2 family protein [Roseivirga sp.]|nr:nuclear transport factor 2 family protein [Roseivirga sp.]
MRHFFVLASLFLLFSCENDVNIESEKEQIIQAAKAFSQAYIDGDLAKQMSYYTDDAVIIPGNRPMIQGIDEVTRYWDIPASIKVLEHRINSTQLEVDGNLASDFGIYEGVSVNNNDTTAFRGQYVITWRKGKDGQWRMAVDMWSALRN